MTMDEKPWLLKTYGRMQSSSLLSLRALCLFAAVFVYALFGSPTPDAPGAPELIVGVLLMLAAGPGLARLVLKSLLRFSSLPPWQAAGVLMLAYGFAFLPLIGALHGHSAGDMLRDLIPFLFFLMPLMLQDMFRLRPDAVRALLAMALLSGWIFAARSLFSGIWIFHAEALYYLGNAPTVLLAGLLLPLLPFCWGRHYAGLATYGLMAFGIAAAAVPWAVMAASLQRASFLYALFYFTALLLLLLSQRPGHGLLALIVLTVAGLFSFAFLNMQDVFFLETAFDVAGALQEKNQLVGSNSRLLEANAVWTAVSEMPGGIFWGGGWGAEFASPAVAGIRVGFTHNLLTSLLLKGGIIFVGLGAVYLWGIATALFGLAARNPVLGLALAGAFAINVFLYASFKSLDFGLLLLLIVSAAKARQLQENA